METKLIAKNPVAYHNFNIEDKYAYQADIGTEIEYSTINYKFNSFNSAEDILLPY